MLSGYLYGSLQVKSENCSEAERVLRPLWDLKSKPGVEASHLQVGQFWCSSRSRPPLSSYPIKLSLPRDGYHRPQRGGENVKPPNVDDYVQSVCLARQGNYSKAKEVLQSVLSRQSSTSAGISLEMSKEHKDVCTLEEKEKRKIPSDRSETRPEILPLKPILIDSETLGWVPRKRAPSSAKTILSCFKTALSTLLSTRLLRVTIPSTMLFTRSANAESQSEGDKKGQKLRVRLFRLVVVQDIIRELGEVSRIFEIRLNAI